MEALKILPHQENRATLPDGTRIVIEYAPANDDGFGDVEEHESEHAVIAIKNGTTVIEASVIPEGNSLGHVSMASFDPIAAATSKGRAGNGHDRAIVENAGQSFEANGSVAHGMIRRYKKHVRAVASALTRKKRLTGEGIQKIIDRVEQGESIRIHLFAPDGGYRLITKRVKDEKEFFIKESDLPKDLVAANENERLSNTAQRS